MTDLAELLRRCEEASGPDREIDGALALMEGWTFTKMKGDRAPYWREPGVTEWYMRANLTQYTTSIDAALALVSRKLPGPTFSLDRATAETPPPKVVFPVWTWSCSQCGRASSTGSSTQRGTSERICQQRPSPSSAPCSRLLSPNKPAYSTIRRMGMGEPNRRRVALYAAPYIILGFVSFGWAYNHGTPDIRCWGDRPTDCFETMRRPLEALAAGVFWPAYWGGKAALAVTQWP